MVSSACVHLVVLSLFCVTFCNGKSVALPSVDTKTADQPQSKQDTPIVDVKLNQSPFNGISKEATNSKQTVSKVNKSFKLPPREFLSPQPSHRSNKMLDFFSFFPDPIVPPYQSPDYYAQHGYFNDMHPMEVDEMMARANRRRPNGNENSPIYYIRLPPTPYMFVPGMGYISQPPTIQPLSPQYSMPQQQVPVNPFLNVPVNFLSNGKPTNVYQWNNNPAFGPQYPSYLPTRPHHRPGYRPKPYLHDSKITHLKGPYVFNGRPEDIYVLPNDPYQQSPYRPHYSSNFNSHPYNSQMYNTPYNSGFNSVYPDPMEHFY
ncbi:uncharacterized protein LOC119068135 [Bradysia coprophila]|uniref:uncharacterized protein LOC119068135 n=1 Tax=Bradysia coprophila TaxID=38358 RepID=UPI00187DBCA8|nr:uncharacterized protein LOC119068135 [Bradysia coprophila]